MASDILYPSDDEDDHHHHGFITLLPKKAEEPAATDGKPEFGLEDKVVGSKKTEVLVAYTDAAKAAAHDMFDFAVMSRKDATFSLVRIYATLNNGHDLATSSKKLGKEIMQAVRGWYAAACAVIDAKIAAGTISYLELWRMFEKEKYMVGVKTEAASNVVTRIKTGGSFYHQEGFYYVQGNYYEHGETKLRSNAAGWIILPYDGDRAVEDLRDCDDDPVGLATASDIAIAAARGRALLAVSKGHHLLYHAGRCVVGRGRELSFAEHDSKVMVDFKTLGFGDDSGRSVNVNIGGFTEEEYAMVDPMVTAWSFQFNRTVWINVSQLTPVVWRTGVFENIIIPADVRLMLEALMQADTSAVKLPLQNRSRCLTLFEGPPGSGKTAAIHAAAEHYKRAVLKITVGMLGRNTDDCEALLRRYFRYATTWGAVVHIDDADLMVAERKAGELQRNALVSAVMTELENAQCPVFMTANRPDYFDSALLSRVTLRVAFPLLSIAELARILSYLLKYNGLDVAPHECIALAKRAESGRRAENVVCVAVQLARHLNEPLALTHLERVFDIDNSGALAHTNGVHVADMDM